MLMLLWHLALVALLLFLCVVLVYSPMAIFCPVVPTCLRRGFQARGPRGPGGFPAALGFG